jgi:ABC-type dipeptide/oligopeptide/nickel transport system permease component
VLLLQNSAFSFSDFFAYIKAFILKGTFGLSDSNYPQTVQYFILKDFPHSLIKFLLILGLCLCTLGVFLFVLTVKKKMNCEFSKFSVFLHMDKAKILKQAKIAALPGQALFWSFFAPLIFCVLLFVEYKFEVPGIGNSIKTAYCLNDFQLLYGDLFCAFIFAFALNISFLTIKIILPHR